MAHRRDCKGGVLSLMVVEAVTEALSVQLDIITLRLRDGDEKSAGWEPRRTMLGARCGDDGG